MSTKILNHRKLKRKKSLQNSVKTTPVLILHPERIPMRIWVPVSLLSTTPKKNSQNLKKPHPLQLKKRNLEKTPDSFFSIAEDAADRKSTRLNSSHVSIS